jgi:hypothetical protein
MVIPVSGAGSSRVTHPFAGLPTPEGVVLPRLACVRRAASVRPEPGSNSPLEIINAPAETGAASDPWMKSAPCADPKGRATRSGHDAKTRSQDSWFAKTNLLPGNQFILNRQISGTKGSIPKTGCMYTDFWHTVQFSRSGTRPNPSSHHHNGSTAIELQSALDQAIRSRSEGVISSGRRPSLAVAPPAVNLRSRLCWLGCQSVDLPAARPTEDDGTGCPLRQLQVLRSRPIPREGALRRQEVDP